ncbi:MAG: methyltransferase domain-containing protein, partial [Anaerolineae bacterium]|nr:methyltransferase domain-containing protein [Anaerolineae bacterium]
MSPFLEEIRKYELERVMPFLLRGSSILEIGGGAGWQAKMLAERGFTVVSIDVAGSQYEEYRLWPVQVYDGKHIPFPDNRFDVVFSSNVLEHIPHIEGLQG